MEVRELLDILRTIPYSKLTNDIISCKIRTFEVTYTVPRIDIDFIRGNTCIGFIRVYENTIAPVFPTEYEKNPVYKNYSKCFEAMENVITYLEIIGFRRA